MKRILKSVPVIFLAVILLKEAKLDSHLTNSLLTVTAEAAETIPQIKPTDADTIAEIQWLIKTYYYKDVQDPEAYAKNIFLTGESPSDPHTHYFPPAENENFQNSMHGFFYGIGAVMEPKELKVGNKTEKIIAIRELVKDGPAEKAGMKVDDYFDAIASDGIKENAVKIDRKNPQDLVPMLRGKSGTKAYIRVIRKGEALEFTVTRAEIRQKIFSGKMLTPEIGYAALAGFHGDDTLAEMSEFISSSRNSGMKVMILDLRNNLGGSLDYSKKIVGWFRFKNDQRPIVIMRNGKGKMIKPSYIEKFVDALSGIDQGKFNGLPVVILTNGYSASASEIVTAYFKNYLNAPIVGQRTYGKGTVQGVFGLSNGGSVKFTTAEYFVGANGIKVDKVGIEPTIPVKNPKKISNESEDLQFQRALLEAQKLIK